MPPTQTHINARVDPLYHVTRTRGGGETTELFLKSFISSDDVRGAAAVSLTRWVLRSHTPLFYHEVGCLDESGCYFTRMFGRNSVPVKTKCPNIY